MKDISPKHIQNLRANEESAHTHPQPIGKSGEGESDDEDGEEGRDEHDQRFGGKQVEEKP